MSTHTTIAAAVLMGALAVPAGAQQHQHGPAQGQDPGMMMSCPMMQQMMQDMHGPMMGGMEGTDMQGMQGRMMGPAMMGTMGAMHGGPAMILRSSEALELTPAQAEQLGALQEEVRAEHQEHMQAAMAAHRSAAAALEADAPDLDAYQEALDEAASHMVRAHVAMTRTALEARELLTPDQREKLGEVMEGMHGGMMQGGGGGLGESP